MAFPDVFFTEVRYDLQEEENDEDEECNEEEEWEKDTDVRDDE